MHDIEPFYSWREKYTSEEDPKSPFYRREYSEMYFENQVYNYFIHPQWDSFGSKTLYVKILYTDYDKGFAILELIGEWNDCLYNDIMYLYQEVITPLLEEGVIKYMLLCENVLNFFGSDDCYYEEWKEEVVSYGGWICFINLLPHVKEEMNSTQLDFHVGLFGDDKCFNWRKYDPAMLCEISQRLVQDNRKLS